MVNGKNNAHVGTKIPQDIRFLLEKAVVDGIYLNVSEYVRQPVKEKLGREGYLSHRN
jgi:Arc/MetJ-type ribon-helix-helix transcriptional regulator